MPSKYYRLHICQVEAETHVGKRYIGWVCTHHFGVVYSENSKLANEGYSVSSIDDEIMPPF